MELVGNQAHTMMLDCESIKLLLLNEKYWQKDPTGLSGLDIQEIRNGS